MPKHDALLLISYGGPESPEDVRPFLNRVLYGKTVPEQRIAAVEQKYLAMAGISPLPEECRRLIRKLCQTNQFCFRQSGNDKPSREAIPLYWGNLFGPPFLKDTIEFMVADNVQRPLIFATSPWQTPQSDDRYRSAVQSFLPPETEWAKVPSFYLTTEYLRASADCFLAAWAELSLATPFDPIEEENKSATLLLFTAHAIPQIDADRSHYEGQLQEHLRHLLQLVFPGKSENIPRLSESSGEQHLVWEIGWQSRSGRPSEPWTEPAIETVVERFVQRNRTAKNVMVVPVGFFLENMETVWDLDVEFQKQCDRLGLNYFRAVTPGTSRHVVRLCQSWFEES